MLSHSIQPVLLLWLACASCVVSLAAGDTNSPTSAAQTYRITHWTTEQGLPQNGVLSLAQTRDGYLWIGTPGGLARFDGVRFTVFDSSNTPEMESDSIQALAEDSDGALWIGTANGLLIYRDREFTRLSTRDGLPERKVWRLIPSRAGGVWMHVGGSVAHWREGRPTVTVNLKLSADDHVRSLHEREDGSVIVIAAKGFKRVTAQGELENWPMPAGKDISSVAGAWTQDRDGRFWLSAADGLWCYSRGNWRLAQERSCNAEIDHGMYEDRTGQLWIHRGEAGLWRCLSERAEPIRLDDRGAEQSVICLTEDREGQMWIGSEHGLFQLRPTFIRTFSSADGLPGNDCWSVCEGPDHTVWVQTKTGVARIKNDRVEAVTGAPNHDPQRTLLVDAEGVVWLTQQHGGIFAWQPGVATNHLWHTPDGARNVECLYLDREGRVWVGWNRGATCFDRGQSPTAPSHRIVLPDGVRAIHQARDGTMWFGTATAGVVRWRSADFQSAVSQVSKLQGFAEGRAHENFERSADWKPVPQPREQTGSLRYTTADGLADDRVFAFHEDTDGALWIGTHNGVSRFKSGRFFTFTTAHGLFDNLINHILEDDFGRLWFSCNRGIFRMDRNALNAVADGRRSRANATVYGAADGMLDSETNGEHQPAGCKTSDGRLWFPTQQGVCVITPRARMDDELPPPVVIEKVKADGLEIGNSKSEIRDLKLSAGGARVLEIHYTANSLTVPEKVRFKYKLEPNDSEWHDAGAQRAAFFTNLRPGHYNFRVQACNHYGMWNEAGASFAFSLAPHFYETWMFYVVCAVGVIGLAGAAHAYRLRWQRRLLKLEEQRALEHERARIARDLHDDLGTALTGLALEMDVASRDTSAATPVSRKLDAAAQHARLLADRMREVVWAVNPRCDNVPSLAGFLEQQAGHILRSAGLAYRLELPEEIPDLPLDAETRHELALCVREALTNVLRHARAKQVTVSLFVKDESLAIQIADDGIGFDPSRTNGNGHGLANLDDRLKRIGGAFQCQRGDRGGMILRFLVPLKTGAPQEIE